MCIALVLAIPASFKVVRLNHSRSPVETASALDGCRRDRGRKGRCRHVGTHPLCMWRFSGRLYRSFRAADSDADEIQRRHPQPDDIFVIGIRDMISGDFGGQIMAR